MPRYAMSFWAPRVEQGLPQKVFFDPSRKRAARILYSMTGLMLLVIGWLVAFAAALLSTQQSAFALSDDLTWLKGYLAAPEKQHQTDEPDVAAQKQADHIDHAQVGSARGCVVSPSKREKSQQLLRVYGVLPSENPFASNSLDLSCNVVSVLMPSWYNLSLSSGEIALQDVGEPAQEPVWQFADQNSGVVELMPVVSISFSVQRLLQTDDGRKDIIQKLFVLSEQLIRNGAVTGLCLDLDGYMRDSFTEARLLFEPLAAGLMERGLNACVAFAADAAPSVLDAANQTFDLVIAKGFRAPWIGSTPQPISPDTFFADQIELFQSHVSSEKLIFALGTFAVDWTSGNPVPSKRSFADVMEALGQVERRAEFFTEVGNSQAVFVDGKGLQHRVWIADVASAANQVIMLKEAGVTQAAIWGLGYEDPGIWAALKQLSYSNVFDPSTVSHVFLNGYVSYTGEGPFVAPLAMPTVGKRDLKLNPTTGRVQSLEYSSIPRPSAVHLYGKGQPGQVVLTFDDGPHPKYTSQTLAILREMGVPASFFVLGHNAIKSPEIIEQILSEGHELGSHTYWHPKMSNVSEARARAEINSVQNLVAGITGRQMKLYREPYMRSGGPISAREVSSLMPLEQAGYVIAGMDVVPRDWIDQSPEALALEIISQVDAKGGGVVLLHDGGGDQSATVAALPAVIEELRSMGYQFTSLANYLGTSNGALMPSADAYASLFHRLSYVVVGSSWKLLEIAFWVIFGVGSARAALTLFLAFRRKRHQILPGSSYQTATVVIPAYNEEAVLGRCLAHVLASDYPHLDVIVVDDGSTDGTRKVALKYEFHPKVSIISQKNRGKAAALNAALDATESEVLICIDADSQIHRKAISHLMAHFDDPEIGAIAGRVVVGNRGNLITGLQALEYITAQSIDRRAKEYLNAVPVVPGAIGAWRTNSVLEAGIFSSETLTEDADMTMAIIRSGYRVIYEEKAIATTEAPAHLAGLFSQRLRWNLGMMQAGWKHAGAFREGRALGLVSLTDLLVFGYLMPLLAPLADIFLLILLAGALAKVGGYDLVPTASIPVHLLVAYLCLPALDLLYTFMAFRFDAKEDRRLLLLFPLQRLLYRPLLYVSVYSAVWRAVSGSLANWGTIGRVGFRFDHERVA